jgi:hypothetical protein
MKKIVTKIKAQKEQALETANNYKSWIMNIMNKSKKIGDNKETKNNIKIILKKIRMFKTIQILKCYQVLKNLAFRNFKFIIKVKNYKNILQLKPGLNKMRINTSFKQLHKQYIKSLILQFRTKA